MIQEFLLDKVVPDKTFKYVFSDAVQEAKFQREKREDQRRGHSRLLNGILATSLGLGILSTVRPGAEAEPGNCDNQSTYTVHKNTLIHGPVDLTIRCDYTYADRYPAGEVRVNAGATLDTVQESLAFLKGNDDLLNQKANGNVLTKRFLAAGSELARNHLKNIGFNVDALTVDNVLTGGSIRLADVPQYLIQAFPDLQDQILAKFSQIGIRVEERGSTNFTLQNDGISAREENHYFVLTDGVVPQVVVNPRDLQENMFIAAEIVPQNLHNPAKFLFGTNEEYYVYTQRQEIRDDGGNLIGVRFLVGLERGACFNQFETEFKIEMPLAPAVPGAIPTATLVMPIATPGVPPVVIIVPSIPTMEVFSTPTPAPAETPGAVATATRTTENFPPPTAAPAEPTNAVPKATQGPAPTSAPPVATFVVVPPTSAPPAPTSRPFTPPTAAPHS